MACLLSLVFAALLLYETLGLYSSSADARRDSTRLQKYSELNQGLSKAGEREKRYRAFKIKLNSIQSTVYSATPLVPVLDYLERHLDANSVVERLTYDTDKQEALAYVLATNPAALEKNINANSEREPNLDVAIVSKSAVKNTGTAVLYELRFSL